MLEKEKNNVKYLYAPRGPVLKNSNFDLINRYYNNSISRVDLDIISRFCYVLNCNISDILEYTPSNEK